MIFTYFLMFNFKNYERERDKNRKGLFVENGTLHLPDGVCRVDGEILIFNAEKTANDEEK